MHGLPSILLIIALALVVGALVTGVVGFVRGGEFNRRYANALMNWRVGLQALAVVILGLVMLVHGLG